MQSEDELRPLLPQTLHVGSGRSSREHRFCDLVLILAFSFVLLVVCVRIGIPIEFPVSGSVVLVEDNPISSSIPSERDRVASPPGFESAANVQVPRNKDAFPSYWNFAGNSINVTYDNRSILLNGERSLFLSGSMHPARSTRDTWNMALDEAVHQGLNMITIYVIWAAHQPMKDSAVDWTLQFNVSCGADSESNTSSTCAWDLAQAIWSAAQRGLFVLIRLGPYVCAEYTYGGIPEWLPLVHDDMAMRRPNIEWMKAMESYLNQAVAYLRDNHLFAHQGGPIVMAQIENELGGDMDPSTEWLLQVDRAGNFVERGTLARSATLQDYADWCGNLAEKLAPDVLWTMCYGLAANNTIETYNGFFYETSWLINHGGSGRVQTEQPALWTEDEGGFQIWGEEPNQPTDYVWGTTARSMAYTALRWFARGGSHLNFYMWWGGYNRGRSAAAGIMNQYASDAPLCPSGQRHHPKFDHFQTLLLTIQDVAPTLLTTPTALNAGVKLFVKSSDGSWVRSGAQLMFLYRKNNEKDEQEVVFVENASNVSCTVRVPVRQDGGSSYDVLTMKAYSGVVYVDGSIVFDSSVIDASAKAFSRRFESKPVKLRDWVSFVEPVGAHAADKHTRYATIPTEQTKLLIEQNIFSDYAWYETDISIPDDSMAHPSLLIDTQEANAVIAYIDGTYRSSTDTHNHVEGDVTLFLQLGPLTPGRHTLSLLSESLGYSNLIGRWGGSTKAKKKGVTGDVKLLAPDHNMSLTDGRIWRMSAGLHGEWPGGDATVTRADLDSYLDRSLRKQGPTAGGLWSSSQFYTPAYDAKLKALYVEIKSGRGHFYLNGNDLGRYWNITRGDTSERSQQYYFLPNDFLLPPGVLNDLTFFDALGGDHRNNRLLLSWLESSDTETLEDEVDYPQACI